MITISVVSHGQGELLSLLLKDIESYEIITSIILTVNIAESPIAISPDLKEKVIVLENQYPKGFGANHNAAFTRCTTPFFCVLNPDVRMSENPFPELINALTQTQAAMCAPAIVNSKGDWEDSVRFFPTPTRLLKKILTGQHEVYKKDSSMVFPHWVAGMFMLFSSKAYQALNGFNEKYFLYYEDVDICARIWKSGMRLLVNQRVYVEHNAQRTSRKKLKYLRWHLISMCRFFMCHLKNLPNPDSKTGLLIES